jgi:hypothetical protein
MTSEDIRSELEQRPFIPFRLHLVSGKTFDVSADTTALLLQNALVILDRPPATEDEGNYNVISLRNIERIERIY